MSEARMYIVYDGRAASGDTEKAQILLATDDFEEAKQSQREYGDAVIFSYKEITKEDGSRHLIDERLESN